MKSDELANELQEIANQLEKCRLKIFQTPKNNEDEEYEEYVNNVDNQLFTLQSEIKNVSENVKYMFFEEDWK